MRGYVLMLGDVSARHELGRDSMHGSVYEKYNVAGFEDLYLAKERNINGMAGS